MICYADKFYSKSHPERERSVNDTARSLEKFGLDGVCIFWTWVKRFEPEWYDESLHQAAQAKLLAAAPTDLTE